MLLRTHLERCDSCRAFGDETASLTAALREAPFELPSRSFAVPSRRRLALQPLRVPAIASLVVSAIAAGSLVASLHSSGLSSKQSPSIVQAGFDDQGVRQLQLQKASSALAELRLRKAQVQFSRIPRHPGFQNP